MFDNAVVIFFGSIFFLGIFSIIADMILNKNSDVDNNMFLD